VDDPILQNLDPQLDAHGLAGRDLAARGREAVRPGDRGRHVRLPAPAAGPYLFNYRNLFTSTSLSNVQTILDVVAGGYANRTVGVLGAAQVDSRGAINTSRVNGRMLTGSGGGNDVASSAEAVVVTTPHARARLPETVDFVTSPGHRVRAIVTDRAVLERLDSRGKFTLTGVLDRGGTKDDLVRAAVELCGWPLAVADAVELFRPVDGQELAEIRTYDPAGNYVL
jgi:Citrate lyase, alpha subunit (CitF)